MKFIKVLEHDHPVLINLDNVHSISQYERSLEGTHTVLVTGRSVFKIRGSLLEAISSFISKKDTNTVRDLTGERI